MIVTLAPMPLVQTYKKTQAGNLPIDQLSGAVPEGAEAQLLDQLLVYRNRVYLLPKMLFAA